MNRIKWSSNVKVGEAARSSYKNGRYLTTSKCLQTDSGKFYEE